MAAVTSLNLDGLSGAVGFLVNTSCVYASAGWLTRFAFATRSGRCDELSRGGLGALGALNPERLRRAAMWPAARRTTRGERTLAASSDLPPVGSYGFCSQADRLAAAPRQTAISVRRSVEDVLFAIFSPGRVLLTLR